jgi:hypothetical protein
MVVAAVVVFLRASIHKITKKKPQGTEIFSVTGRILRIKVLPF